MQGALSHHRGERAALGQATPPPRSCDPYSLYGLSQNLAATIPGCDSGGCARERTQPRQEAAQPSGRAHPALRGAGRFSPTRVRAGAPAESSLGSTALGEHF